MKLELCLLVLFVSSVLLVQTQARNLGHNPPGTEPPKQKPTPPTPTRPQQGGGQTGPHQGGRPTGPHHSKPIPASSPIKEQPFNIGNVEERRKKRVRPTAVVICPAPSRSIKFPSQTPIPEINPERSHRRPNLILPSRPIGFIEPVKSRDGPRPTSLPKPTKPTKLAKKFPKCPAEVDLENCTTIALDRRPQQTPAFDRPRHTAAFDRPRRTPALDRPFQTPTFSPHSFYSRILRRIFRFFRNRLQRQPTGTPLPRPSGIPRLPRPSVLPEFLGEDVKVCLLYPEKTKGPKPTVSPSPKPQVGSQEFSPSTSPDSTSPPMTESTTPTKPPTTPTTSTSKPPTTPTTSTSKPPTTRPTTRPPTARPPSHPPSFPTKPPPPFFLTFSTRPTGGGGGQRPRRTS